MKTLREVLSERQHAIFDPDGNWLCVEDTRELAEAHAARSRRELAHFNPPPVLEVVPVEKLLAAYRAMAGIPDPAEFMRTVREALEAMKRCIMNGDFKPTNYGDGEKRCKSAWEANFRALAAMGGAK